MEINGEVLTINGVEHVKRGTEDKSACLNGMEYVIVRTYSAGVFAGYLESRNGKEVKMRKARRLWYWSGAATLSQLAMEGVKNPDKCKFPCEVDEVYLTEAIEIIPATNEARISILKVKVWKQ